MFSFSTCWLNGEKKGVVLTTPFSFHVTSATDFAKGREEEEDDDDGKLACSTM